MPTRFPRRGMLALVITAALMLAAMAIASEASASTLYACVKKNGTAKISAKKPKCKKGESKLSWSTTGPAGKNGGNGTNGTNGTNGANGAVAGYYAEQAAGPAIKLKERTISVIVKKTIPAGHYLVSAKVVNRAFKKTAGYAETECLLFDEKVIDQAFWAGPLGEEFSKNFIARSTLPLLGALNTTATSTVELQCELGEESSAGVEVEALDGQLAIVQTSSNS